MPTGYTAIIDDNPTMTAKEWVLTGLVRAFGVCIQLKEDQMGLSVEEIEKRIADDSTVEYHEQKLKEAQEKAKLYAQRTKADWEEEWSFSEAEKLKHNREAVENKKPMAERHDKMLSDLKHLYISDVSEFTKNVAKFGIEQLNLVKDECEPYILEPISFEAYKQEMLRANKRDIDYHTRELQEAKQRNTDRLQAFTDLKADIEKVFSVVPKETKGDNQQ